MVCSISCMISAVFLIGMIYFYNMTNKSKVVLFYKDQLPYDLQKRYEKCGHTQAYGYITVAQASIILERMKLFDPPSNEQPSSPYVPTQPCLFSNAPSNVNTICHLIVVSRYKSTVT